MGKKQKGPKTVENFCPEKKEPKRNRSQHAKSQEKEPAKKSEQVEGKARQKKERRRPWKEKNSQGTNPLVPKKRGFQTDPGLEGQKNPKKEEMTAIKGKVQGEKNKGGFKRNIKGGDSGATDETGVLARIRRGKKAGEKKAREPKKQITVGRKEA